MVNLWRFLFALVAASAVPVAPKKKRRRGNRSRRAPAHPRAHRAAVGRSSRHRRSGESPGQSGKGRAAIAVVDFNGNLISLDAMDGTSGFWVKFAIGKALGAVTLQQSTAESGDQIKTNPQRFHSALSMMEGQIILIPGGFPLIVDNVIVGAVGSAGHRGDGDVRAVKAGIAAWEKFRQSKRQ